MASWRKLEPTSTPLSGNPRFERLVKGYEPNSHVTPESALNGWRLSVVSAIGLLTFIESCHHTFDACSIRNRAQERCSFLKAVERENMGGVSAPSPKTRSNCVRSSRNTTGSSLSAILTAAGEQTVSGNVDAPADSQ